MDPKKWLSGVCALALIAFMSGCGGAWSSPMTGAQSGTVFVTGTDAPLPSVVSFQVDITGITVTDANNNTQSVQRNADRGLRAAEWLADIAGHQHDSRRHLYKCHCDACESTDRVLKRQSAGATDDQHAQRNHVTGSNADAIERDYSLVDSFGREHGNIIGLRFEFNLRNSIAVDGSGQVTGAVTPTLDLKAITPSEADAYVDDFIAGVVSVNAGGNSFIIQGPHGHQFTVNVNGQTEWEGSETISNLTSTSIVEISGALDRTAATFLADSVGILSEDRFFAGGLITYVNPPTNTATDFDLYVRSVLPSGTGFQSGEISTIDLTGNEKYFIYWMHNSWTNHFFNAGLMVPGQHISIGGPVANGAVTVKRVVLRQEGHTGTLVANSVNLNANTFQFNSNGLAGVLFNGPVTVYVTPFTRFGGGLKSLGDLSGNPTKPLRVVGLVLKDPIGSRCLWRAAWKNFPIDAFR